MEKGFSLRDLYDIIIIAIGIAFIHTMWIVVFNLGKMKKPKMDVVRFKENDIIVASGAIGTIGTIGGSPLTNFITISGFNDTTPGNGKCCIME